MSDLTKSKNQTENYSEDLDTSKEQCEDFDAEIHILFKNGEVFVETFLNQEDSIIYLSEFLDMNPSLAPLIIKSLEHQELHDEVDFLNEIDDSPLIKPSEVFLHAEE